MVQFFVNLKRFDVARGRGGICPEPYPATWIRNVANELDELGLGSTDDYSLVFLLPELLIVPFAEALGSRDPERVRGIAYGVQSVFRADVQPGGNFGAFTSNLPASAARGSGSTWAMIGHSEERADKSSLLERLGPALAEHGMTMSRSTEAPASRAMHEQSVRRSAAKVVNQVVADEAARAAEAGLNVLVCIGETAEERGEGNLTDVSERVRSVLDDQLSPLVDVWRQLKDDVQLAIGYEPRWAIGPGRTPPDKEYIGYVTDYIRMTLEKQLGHAIPVVYGGGLKTDNAGEIAAIDSVEGGLIALTSFTGQIGFTTRGLAQIIEAYLERAT